MRTAATIIAILFGAGTYSQQAKPKAAPTAPVPYSMDRTVTYYDRFENVTSIYSAGAKVSSRLVLVFMYICRGNTKQCGSSSVIANFWAASPSPYADSHKVIFLADGLRINADGEESPVGKEYDEVSAGLTTDDFLKLIHAHSAEGRLGPTEFVIQESDLEKWRTFATGITSNKDSVESKH